MKKKRAKTKVKQKHLVTLLVVLILVLILLYSFSVYEGLRIKEVKEDYTVEEVVIPEDIIPSEEEEAPTVEGGGQVEVLNEVTITIKNLRFYPDKVVISPGTTIVWVNNDSAAHKVVSYDRLFYGSRMEPGDKYAFTFTKEGTHRYFDAAFTKIGRGTIIVKEEPLPITGGVIGVDLGEEEVNGKFAMIILLFVVMVFSLSHGMYKHYA